LEPLSFLDAPETGEREPVAEAPVTETPPASEGPARGPDGKFVGKQAEAPAEAPPVAETPPEPAPTSEAAPAASAETAPNSGFVPLAVVLDTRDKLRAAEAELQQLRAQKPQPRLGPTVNPDEDPRGAVEEALLIRRKTELDWSRKVAIKDHGEDAVNEAYSWANARLGETGNGDPAFNAKIAASDDPYALVMQEHQQFKLMQTLQNTAKRDRLLALLSDDAATAAQAPQDPAQAVPAIPPQPAPVAPARTAPTPPPRSIASAAAAASAEVVPVGPGQAFDTAFR